MKTFAVKIQRTEYREHTFYVDAATKSAAETAGLLAACDHNFLDDTVSSAHEEVVSVAEEMQ